MIIASYNDSELLEVSQMSLDADMHESFVSIEDISVPSGTTQIKCMFWDDNDSLVPLVGAAKIGY